MDHNKPPKIPSSNALIYLDKTITPSATTRFSYRELLHSNYQEAYSLLQTRCPHCDEEMAYHFSARVLDTPFCCANCRKPFATAKLRRGLGGPFALKTMQVLTKLRYRHRAW